VLLRQLSFFIMNWQTENHKKFCFNVHLALAFMCPRLFLKHVTRAVRKKLSLCMPRKHTRDWCEWRPLRPGRFTPGETAPVTRLIRGRAGPRTDMHTGETTNLLFLAGIKPRIPSRPACSLVTIPILLSWP
jgi:hypothetical protein